MYDFTSNTWTELPPMQENRDSHGCGVVTLEDGTQELVVAGGYDRTSVEIYNFGTQVWR